MATTPDNRVNATGGCLCGAVRYDILVPCPNGFDKILAI